MKTEKYSMYCPNVSKALRCNIVVLGSLLGYFGLVGESVAQSPPHDSPLEITQELAPKGPRHALPFADYEKRLRQSSRWQAMTPEEQTQALEKVEQARKQFLDRQQQLKTQYEDQIMKMEKPRESLMRKRRKREQYQNIDILWRRFQALPVEERLTLERQLGLDTVMPSQQQHKFQERLDRLSYSKRKHILRQLQQASP